MTPGILLRCAHCDSHAVGEFRPVRCDRVESWHGHVRCSSECCSSRAMLVVESTFSRASWMATEAWNTRQRRVRAQRAEAYAKGAS